jgi:hypothetical protein
VPGGQAAELERVEVPPVGLGRAEVPVVVPDVDDATVTVRAGALRVLTTVTV